MRIPIDCGFLAHEKYSMDSDSEHSSNPHVHRQCRSAAIKPKYPIVPVLDGTDDQKSTVDTLHLISASIVDVVRAFDDRVSALADAERVCISPRNPN
jgi:hypothetical protein